VVQGADAGGRESVGKIERPTILSRLVASIVMRILVLRGTRGKQGKALAFAIAVCEDAISVSPGGRTPCPSADSNIKDEVWFGPLRPPP
jgi:hypothetical protein